MRALLDQECAAVAGGNPFADADDLSDASRESFTSACEEAVTNTTIAAGATAGAIVGSSAGGMGAVPGAIAGASAGHLVGTVVAPPVCRHAYRNRYGSGDEGGSRSPGNWDENTSLTGGTPEPYPPQRLQVNTNNY